MDSLFLVSSILCLVFGLVAYAWGCATNRSEGIGPGALLLVAAVVLGSLSTWWMTRGVPQPDIEVGTYQVLARCEVSTALAFNEPTPRPRDAKWLILIMTQPKASDNGAYCYRFRADLVDREKARDNKETLVVKKGAFTQRMILYERPAPQTSTTIAPTPAAVAEKPERRLYDSLDRVMRDWWDKNNPELHRSLPASSPAR